MVSLAVIALIRTHAIDNPIKSKAIEEAYGIDGTKVRQFVHEARLAGHAIGSNNTGYFNCRTADEWRETRDNLHGRAMSILSLLKKVDESFTEKESLFG